MSIRERDQDLPAETNHVRERLSTRGPILGFAALVLLVLVIYGPGIGHGFVKDDVAWIAANQVSSLHDVRELAKRSNGFYRPLVAASFAVDRAVYGIEPLGYGMTNLLLLIGSAATLVWMSRGVGLAAGAAVVAAAIWALNFNGIHMAVLWLSGRTALWLTMWAFVSAGALARRRPMLAGVAALGAMLSKEEAVMLPLMLAGWAWVLTAGGVDSVGSMGSVGSPVAIRDRVRTTVRLTWPAWIALAVYVALRSQTAAYTPATSPWFYHFTFDPLHLLTNAGEYLDRACTFPAIVLCVLTALAWRLPAFGARERRLAMLGAIWLIGGYAITFFLPVRSSLYACLPSAGAAMFTAGLLETLWTPSQASASASTSTPARQPARRRRMLAALAMPILLLPVYWSRNERWVELADLGADTFTIVRHSLRDTPGLAQFVFEDDRGTRRSIQNTYGALLPTAVTLAAGRDIPVWLNPPPDDWRGSALVPPPADTRGVGRIALRDGHLVRLQ